jgi:tetratricopeptide (TPR) repeat protein
MQPTLTRLQSLAENNLTAENVIALIRALLAREENDFALQWADRALDSGIKDARLYQARADVLRNLALGDSDYCNEAILSYERALLLAPDSAEIHKEFGRLLAGQLRNYERAEQLFLRAIEIAPADLECYGGYAECVIQRGTFREVLHTVERRLNLVKSHTGLLDGMSYQLINYGRYDEARECAEVMLYRQPDHLMALVTISKIAEEQQHDFWAAWRYLVKAVKKHPNEHYIYLSVLVF